jgi:ribosome-associated protein
MEKVKISTDFIKLDQFLKWVGIVGNGSDAKVIIAEGNVKVNGEVEVRRGKKLRSDDIIEFDGKTFQIE